jgi:5-methylcytosine-specific restriction endonuclease McrA
MTRRRESALRHLVSQRAGWRCEYCHAPQGPTGQSFHLDHVVPESRGGERTQENLALACPRCNLTRGEQESSLDPRTRQIVTLFNPRRDLWEKHFRWSPNRLRLIGRTVTGRATIRALKLNAADQIEARMWWYLMGLIP